MMPERQETGVSQSSLVNLECEAALLGALMSENRLVDHVADTLGADDFASVFHGRLFDAIVNTTANGRKASPPTLYPIFAQDEEMRAAGGMGYLAGLTANGSAIIGVNDFAEIIADLAARRRLINALEVTTHAAADPNNVLAEIVDQSDAAIVAAIEKRETWTQASGADCITEAIKRIEAIQANDGKLGATTGICDIDMLLGGFEPGQVVIVAGRPGMGKTAVACSMATGMARRGAGVLFLSLEMKGGELGARMVSDLCFDGRRGIEFDKIINATVDRDQMARMVRAKEAVREWPLSIIDTGTVTISRLNLGIRRAKRRMAAKGQELKVVIIDYLQLLHVDEPGRKSQYEVVSEISRALKAMAKDTGIAIIALAQLSRAVEQRDDKRPQLSDLRDSGQIEQDADAVMFLYREEYYLLKKKKPKGGEALEAHERALTEAASRIDFICAKRRNGRTGDRSGFYFAHFQAVRGSDNYSEGRQ